MRVVRTLVMIALLVAVCAPLGADASRSGRIAQVPDGWWEPIGPWGGECFNVIISPRDVDTVFAVGPAGIHRSLNRGVDWFRVSTMEMRGIFLTLAFKPDNEDEIFAAGTGTGVWRSLDMGDTWKPFGEGLPGGSDDPIDVVSIIFTPDGTAWLGTRNGPDDGYVYRLEKDRWLRTDSGLVINPPVEEMKEDPSAVMDRIAEERRREEEERSMTYEERRKHKEEEEKKVVVRRGPVENPNPHSTLLASDAEGRVWAGVYGGGIFRLDGIEWELVTTAGEGGMKPTCLIPFPGKSKNFYFGTQDDWIWYTITDGKYWKRMPLMETSKEGALPMVQWMAIDPVNNDLLWISVCSYRPGKPYRLFQPIEGQEGGGIAVTLDRGREWFHLFHHPHGYWNNMTIEPGETVNDILGERAAHLWATYDGWAGILYSDLGIRELGRRYRGYHGEEVYSIFLAEGGFFIAATGDGLNRPDEKWEWSYRNLEDRYNHIFCVTQDYTAPDRLLYAVGGLTEENKIDRRGVFRTGIHGWYPLLWPIEARSGPRAQGIYRQDDPVPVLEETPCWSVCSFEFDPLQMWVGTQDRGILFTKDGGETWWDFNLGLPEDASVTSIVLDGEAEPLYAALRDCDDQQWRGNEWRPHSGEGGSVWRYDRTDIVWKRMPGIDGAVYQLDWKPDESARGGGRLRAATCEGVYEWHHAASAWRHISDGLPEQVVSCIAVPDSNPEMIYAGTGESGVWVSLDGGGSWDELNSELFCRSVWRLELDPDDPEHLWAATLGGGVFEFGGD